MIRAVFDASAAIALLQAEPAAAPITTVLAEGVCAISAVNLAEVVSKLAERGVPEPVIVDAVNSLQLEVHMFEENDAFAVGMLCPVTRSRGLSLGDRACLSLGISLGVPVVTTDRAWEGLLASIDVMVVRGS